MPAKSRPRYRDSPAELLGGIALGIAGFAAALLSGMDFAVAAFTGLAGLMLGAMAGDYVTKHYGASSAPSAGNTETAPALGAARAPARDLSAPQVQQALMQFRSGHIPRDNEPQPASPPSTPLEARTGSRIIS